MKSLFGMAMLGQPVRGFRWLITASRAFPRFAPLALIAPRSLACPPTRWFLRMPSHTLGDLRRISAGYPSSARACARPPRDLRATSARPPRDLRATCARSSRDPRRCTVSSPPSSRTSPSTTWSSRSWSALTLRTQPNSNQPTTWSSRYGSALQPPWLPLATRQIFPITRQASSLLLTVPWPRFTCHLWQVYMYLVTHAGEQPDLALLSINNFQARAQPSSEA